MNCAAANHQGSTANDKAMQVEFTLISQNIPAHIRDLYESSFPPAEKRAWAMQQQWIEQRKLQLAALHVQQTFMGFVTWWAFPGFTYIEHFAVAKQARGKGIGSAAIQALQQQHSPLVLEVEKENISPDAARRIRFYEQLGFVIFPFSYRQPPYIAGNPFVPMHLLHTGLPNNATTFTNIQAILYREVYGINELI